MNLRPTYCPACSHHPQLTYGDHEGFGDYYPATCPDCSETYEVPATRIETF
jgi:hypothetical protein